MSDREPLYLVIDADTGKVLPGIPTPMLIDELNRRREAQAWQKFKGQWRYVEPHEYEAAKASGTMRHVQIKLNRKHPLA